MAKVSEFMTSDVQVIEPQHSVRVAAMLMQRLDVGSLPVCDGERLLGMLTDRDIAIRGVAQGLNPEQACVSDVMSEGVEYCTADQDVEDVLRLMDGHQVRRMPVVDAEHRLVGIVALADLTLYGDDHRIGRTVRGISEPDKASP